MKNSRNLSNPKSQNSSVIRQKDESQNGCFKKNKTSQIFVCAYQEVRNVRVSENLACFVFLETPVLRFALLPYYRQIPTSTTDFKTNICTISLSKVFEQTVLQKTYKFIENNILYRQYWFR